MDCRTALEGNYNELSKLYAEHAEDVRTLRLTLLRRILPNILEEGALDSEAGVENARDWMEDDGACIH